MKSELLLPLVDALADGAWHSGEALAKPFSITRAALSKRMAALADLGLTVEARTRVGYRLPQALERLDADRLRKKLSPLAAVKLQSVRAVALTDSTNTQLLSAGGANDPQVLLAEFQSAGRGRRGREWVSPFGANLYLSLAWTFSGWPAQITALPLAVGVACARALPNLPGLALKWPNDLWVNGRKLGGILIEQRGEAGADCRAVIGIGLNVAMRKSQAHGVTQDWTSLHAEGQTVSRNTLAADLISKLVEALLAFEARGFAPFAAEWLQHDATLGKKITVQHGMESLPGIGRGVDDDGALKLEVRGKLQRVLSGDVSLRLA